MGKLVSDKLTEAYRLEQEAARLRREAHVAKQRRQMARERAFEEQSGIDIGLSDDYAVLAVGGHRFYFGYEFTIPEDPGDDDDAEWAFVVHSMSADGRARDEIMRMPQSAVHPSEREDPAFYLLCGIAHYLNRDAS